MPECMIQISELLQIEPYAGVGPLRFGMSEAEISALIGEPSLPKISRQDGEKWFFDHLTLVLEKRMIVEIGITRDANATLAGIDLFHDPGSFKKLCEIDSDPKEILGTIILFNLGISLTGFHDNDYDQLAATAFELGRWDSLRPQMRDYP